MDLENYGVAAGASAAKVVDLKIIDHSGLGLCAELVSDEVNAGLGRVVTYNLRSNITGGDAELSPGN